MTRNVLKFAGVPQTDGAQKVNFLDPGLPASLMQHISDLHFKFALGPHDV